MAYQIFRVAKVRRQGVGGCQREHNRTEQDVGRFPDSEIDYSKTSQNIYLVKSNDYWGDIKKKLTEHGITSWRKDAVVMNDAIYTASPVAISAMSRSQQMEYFQGCLAWHEKHFGPAVNAVVHFDETTPHLHVSSVPLVQKEDGTWKLCAKDQYGNQTKMASLQTSLHNEVSRHFGLERGETRTAGEQRKHKTKLESDIECLSERKTESIAENEQLSARNYTLTKAIAVKEKLQPKKLIEQGGRSLYVGALAPDFDKWLEEMKKRYRGAFGKYKLSQEDIEYLLECATKVEHDSELFSAMKAHINELENTNESLVAEVNELKKPFILEENLLFNAKTDAANAKRKLDQMDSIVARRVQQGIQSQNTYNNQLVELSKRLKAQDGRSMFDILNSAYIKAQKQKRAQEQAQAQARASVQEPAQQVLRPVVKHNKDDIER